MPRIAREVDDAFRAVTLTRLFLAAGRRMLAASTSSSGSS
jgi:hypothetical protein